MMKQCTAIALIMGVMASVATAQDGGSNWDDPTSCAL
jgi:hypothetical protein